MTRKFTKMMVAFALLAFLAAPMGGWGQTKDEPTTIYLETFGSTSSNTAYSSYNGFTATQSMFTDTTVAVNTHYTGSGSVGKNNLAAANLSNGYTGASGLSGCYHTGTANTQSTIIQISDINIAGYENLNVSFGALGGSTSHKVNVQYKIDDDESFTDLIVDGAITNANWTLLSQSIETTGTSLTLRFTHTPTKTWTIRMDDIKVTGVAAAPSGPTITAEDVNIEYGATSGSIAYTINNGVDGGILTAATTSDWLTLGTVGETVPFTCSANDSYDPRIETVTLTYTYGRNQVTKDVTVTQAAHLPSITVADATVDVGYEGTKDTLDVTYDNIAVIAAEVDFCNANGETASYDWITANIVAENNNVEYTVLPNTGAARTAYFKVWAYDNELNEVYSNLVTVNQAVAQVTYSYSINGDLGSSDPSTSTFGATIPLNDGENLNDDFTFAGWTTNPNAVSETERLTGSTTLNAPHTTFYAVYEHTTVTGTTTTKASYVKVTSTDDITDGNYLIVYEDGEVAFDGSLETLDVAHNNFSVDIVNNSIEATAKTDVSYFTIASKTGGYSVKSASGLYIGATAYENKLKTSETDDYTNIISFDDEDLVMEVAINTTQSVTLRFNSASGDSNDRFRYYKSGQQAIQLYKYTAGGSTPATTTAYYTRVFQNETPAGNITITGPSIIPSGQILNMGENVLTNELGNASFIIEDGAQLFEQYGEVLATVQKHIAAHGTSEGWNFIASPITGAITPSEGNGIINGTVGENNNTYDLYYYDEPERLWKNYESATFNIQPQKGYLYANSVETILSFAGELQPCDEAITIPASNLSCSASTLTGFNLVGNPFPCKARLNRSYFVINGMVVEACSESDAIDPCAGVMVQITNDDKVVTFTPVEPTAQTPQPNQLQLVVAQQVVTRSGMNSIVNDNAIINFNAGSQLEKFAFNEDAAKLYIPQNGKDFAIVSAEGQGEMPVNFRAAQDGAYTLSVNPEGVEMNYLHLIDNMTGADVDLLADASTGSATYTFNATTRDYESRFRLVFAANNENGASAGSTTFAYFSNGNLVINNEGNATLQVVDVMGRIVKSESINGSASIDLNTTPGVYMLRLVNGNNVKVQKMVVR